MPDFSALGDAALQALLTRAWLEQDTDLDALRSLCTRAVERAQHHGEAPARFWSHLTRTLLIMRHAAPDMRAADLQVAHELVAAVPDPRAPHLLAAAQALHDGLVGRSAQAYAAAMALPLRSRPGCDHPDDAFVLAARFRPAYELGQLEEAFHVGYLGLMLAERIGPPVRVATAALRVSAALCAANQHAECVKLLEPLIADGCFPSSHAPLRRIAVSNVAIAKFMCGRHAEAYDELCRLLEPFGARCDEFDLFAARTNLARACIVLNRLQEARAQLRPAFDFAARCGSMANLATCEFEMGLMHGHDQRHREAIEWLERARAHYAEDADLRAGGRAEVGAALAAHYAALGEHQLAYERQKEFMSLRASFDALTTRSLLALQRAQHKVASDIRLSPRELECLQWCAAGKTAWETGQIVGLSEWTVVYHLEKAKRKFGLNSKQRMVARAVSLGLVRPGV